MREALRTGKTPLADFHGQLLRLVYRLIFLFVAEDRTIEGQSLLHPRDESDAAQLARERYAAHYSTGRLRELASRIKGSRHGDLWRQFQLLVGALSGDTDFAAAREHLALPVLGSFLWDPATTAGLNYADLTNHDFLEALRHLAFTRQGKVLRPVDYKNLGAEELGGVYESLLALTPQISADGARFTFAEFAGSERKTSGSYYTPDSLVQCLLDSALDPVVEKAIQGKTGAEAEKAILALKVCDPAVGSGHFLVGAAHRRAMEFYEEDLALAREIGDRREEGAALGSIGNVYNMVGEHRLALQFYAQDLVIAREIGDREGVGTVLANISLALASLGEWGHAIKLAEKALEILKVESPAAEVVRQNIVKWRQKT